MRVNIRKSYKGQRKGKEDKNVLDRKRSFLKTAKRKEPKTITLPLNTNEENEYITINYTSDTLKYIPHARRTSTNNPKRKKYKRR